MKKNETNFFENHSFNTLNQEDLVSNGFHDFKRYFQDHSRLPN